MTTTTDDSYQKPQEYLRQAARAIAGGTGGLMQPDRAERASAAALRWAEVTALVQIADSLARLVTLMEKAAGEGWPGEGTPPDA